MPQDLREWFNPFHKTSHIFKLYLHYCYLLGVLPKNTEYKPTSPYLKEDLKKLEEFSEQMRYMSKYGIEIFDNLHVDRDGLQGEMDKLIACRTESLQRFIDKAKRVTRLEALTPELVHEFIEKIIVSAPEYKDGKRYQEVAIHYNGVGIIREPIAEEMEEYIQEHIKDKPFLKAKTA